MLLLSCKEVARLISESLDRELSPLQNMAVRIHLFYCRFCSRYRQQVLLIRDAISHYIYSIDREDALPSVPLRPEARKRIKELLARKES